MKKVNINYFFFLVILFIISVKPLFGQLPEFSKVPNLHKGDSLNISYLIANGVKISSGKVTAWFPKDSLPEKKMNEIVIMLNAGINGAVKFINTPLPWQVHNQNEPYIFYFRFDRFVSHASKAGFVSIPFWRIKEGNAPWLHEVLHEMLYSKSEQLNSGRMTEKEWDEKFPLWLYEGLPDYISLKVSIKEKLPYFDVFSNSNQNNFDSLFINDINTPKAHYILSFIGSKGVMPELFSNDRFQYAPAFYHGSSSFVKYIAEKYDLNILLSGISTFAQEQETIEKLVGKPIEIIKKEWCNKLNIGQY